MQSSQGEGGVTKKITKDHRGSRSQGGGNNYSQDQLSMGGSRGDIFEDHY